MSKHLTRNMIRRIRKGRALAELSRRGLKGEAPPVRSAAAPTPTRNAALIQPHNDDPWQAELLAYAGHLTHSYARTTVAHHEHEFEHTQNTAGHDVTGQLRGPDGKWIKGGAGSAAHQALLDQGWVHQGDGKWVKQNGKPVGSWHGENQREMMKRLIVEGHDDAEIYQAFLKRFAVQGITDHDFIAKRLAVFRSRVKGDPEVQAALATKGAAAITEPKPLDPVSQALNLHPGEFQFLYPYSTYPPEKVKIDLGKSYLHPDSGDAQLALVHPDTGQHHYWAHGPHAIQQGKDAAAAWQAKHGAPPAPKPPESIAHHPGYIKEAIEHLEKKAAEGGGLSAFEKTMLAKWHPTSPALTAPTDYTATSSDVTKDAYKKDEAAGEAAAALVIKKPKKPLVGARQLMENLINQGKTKEEILSTFTEKFNAVGTTDPQWIKDRLAKFHAEHTGSKKTTWEKTHHVPGVTKTKSVSVSEGDLTETKDTKPTPPVAPPKPTAVVEPVAPGKELTLDEKKALGVKLQAVVDSFPEKFKVKHNGLVVWAKVQPYEYLAAGSKIDPATGHVQLKVVTEGGEQVAPQAPYAVDGLGSMWDPGSLKSMIGAHKASVVTPPVGTAEKEFHSTEDWVGKDRKKPTFGGYEAHHQKLLKEQGAKLTAKQDSAVDSFTGSGSGMMNPALANDTVDKLSSGYKTHIEQLEQAIDKWGHFKEPVELYRGISLTKEQLQAWKEAADNGQALKFKAFSSTSSSKPWDKNTQLVIKTNKGLAVVGTHPSELEVIMNKGWHYKVYKYSIKAGKYGSPTSVWHLECLGPDNQ